MISAVDGSMSADDVELHTLPLYHCAQLDCFLGVDVYLGATSVILPGPDPAAIPRAIEEHRVTVLRAADGVDRAAAPPRLRRRRPVLAPQRATTAPPMPVEILREIQRRLPDVAL